MGEFVVCELCGQKFRQITNTHLRKFHDTTLDEYKEVFPNSRTHLRKKKDKTQSKQNNKKIEMPNSLSDIKNILEEKFGKNEVVVGYAHDRYLTQDYDFFFIVDFSIPKRKIAIDLIFHHAHKKDPREHLKQPQFLACGWTYEKFETQEDFMSWLNKY